MANRTIDPGHLATAKATHTRDNPPDGPQVDNTAAITKQIKAVNPSTLRDANRLRTKMMEESHSSAERGNISRAFAPILAKLRRVE